MQKHIIETLGSIREQGLFKREREILGAQQVPIRVKQGEVLNFCANNYLGLANHPELLTAAKQGIDSHGYGMASVRFICGTQDIHRELERKIAAFLRMDDAILHSSCFDANAGLFEALLTKEDAIISDSLNHASIIDGVRLCKAKRFIFEHMDMDSLREKLKEAQSARNRLIATDGVFSMDGDIANLKEMCELAEEFDAAVMVDDSHATGFFGPGGRGTPAECGVEGKVSLMTSTLGKALGGASGGFITGEEQAIELFRQKSRPYLFSNSLAPPIVATSLKALELVEKGNELRKQLMDNTARFRKEMAELGFSIRKGTHPIVPVMLGEEKLAVNLANLLLKEGIYVVGFAYPVVPKGKARIRVQLSAAHTPEHLDKALSAFESVGQKLKII